MTAPLSQKCVLEIQYFYFDLCHDYFNFEIIFLHERYLLLLLQIEPVTLTSILVGHSLGDTDFDNFVYVEGPHLFWFFKISDKSQKRKRERAIFLKIQKRITVRNSNGFSREKSRA